MVSPPRGDGSGTPAVRTQELRCSFGAIEAVRGISLEIRQGATFGLLGPNGAGKTTLLSMLSTLLPPTAGDARIFGRSLADEAAAIRPLVGLAPQQISLYPKLTGEENLLFFGRLYGRRGPPLRARTRQLLELFGLHARAADRVELYSGGMQRRLNLACALVHEPRLLLLDEPTVGVDPQSRENILSVIRELASGGATILYTTHYMEEAERLCDRIAIVDQGEVIAEGTCQELLGILGPEDVVEVGVDLERVFMHLTPTVLFLVAYGALAMLLGGRLYRV